MIPIFDSAILTRNNNTVAKLRPTIGNDLKNAVLPAAAIKLWKVHDMSVDQLAEAISCMGRFLAHRYFSSDSANKMSHYCPVVIKSQVGWRLFVSDVLDLCAQDEGLSNLELTWKEWANLFRQKSDQIIFHCQAKYDEINIDPSLVLSKYSAPMKESKNKVSATLGVIEPVSYEQIRITNFHQIKGETLDAIMVVSTPTNQGNTEGYWKNWLVDKKSENARFAYVASSRPRKLLVWAIPDPITTQDKEILDNLGLKFVSDF
jgi:DNA helicase-2/ATP-dependent DNA helicase PcrA